MSVQYFYNFCLKEADQTDLSGDLLSGVRRSFFGGTEKIRDKITVGSEGEPYSIDFSIEKEKPMKWQVRDSGGKTVQDVMLSDNGKYYLYYYEAQALVKRLLFSKHHTLLKIEYFDAASGAVTYTLEPRKAQSGLCILLTKKACAKPIPLFEEPELSDSGVEARMRAEFDDYTVIASTDKGIVRFLSEEQLTHFRAVKEQFEQEAAAVAEETFVDNTPFLDKISAKDFNVKRNLSSSLDITRALEFGVQEGAQEAPAEPEPSYEAEAASLAQQAVNEILAAVPATPEPVEPEPPVPEQAEAIPAAEEPAAAEQPEPAAAETAPAQAPAPIEAPVEAPDEASVQDAAPKPDKLIMVDGAVYSYYGELDEQGNRSGYGRTVTEIGRTAYEGGYFRDKRSGNGSYFYKNGSLCYTGDWYENARHGVGVGVSSRDGSIHVGTWKNNKPEGSGVRLTSDGEIRFVCRELADGTTVLMNYLPDDTVLISKYDKHGMKIGEKSLSLKELF